MILREEITRTKKIMGLLMEDTSYNDLDAQVREVGLHFGDLKVLKNEVSSNDSLSDGEKQKLTTLIDSKIKETGLNEDDVEEQSSGSYSAPLEWNESCGGGGVDLELDSTLDLAKQGEFFEHDDGEEDDRPDDWREKPGYNPEYFYDEDSILNRFKRVLHNVSDEQSVYNKENSLPPTWKGSKEGYHEYITNKTFSSGSNE
tara:strand:- start:3822 stop:4424 length:603 start_codon:yes stop_codon:yes gene_type:complete